MIYDWSALDSSEERPEVDLLGQMELTQVRVYCPGDCPLRGSWSIPQVIIHLNDGHQWIREDIADWLELESDRQGFSIELKTE